MPFDKIYRVAPSAHVRSSEELFRFIFCLNVDQGQGLEKKMFELATNVSWVNHEVGKIEKKH